MRALVPAYVPPDELLALAGSPRPPRTVIVNPDSGPGARYDPAYDEAVGALRAVGARVLGYVATGYGRRAATAVLADVVRYVGWYGVDGTFFDEVASGAELLEHYGALAGAARRGGARLVVLNPGVTPAPGYFALADVVVTFEGDHAGYASALAAMPGWLRRVAPERVAHLLHGTSAAQAAAVRAAAAAGHLYATPGVLPNPWRTLEEQAVAACV